MANQSIWLPIRAVRNGDFFPDADDYEDYGDNNNKGDKDKDDHSKDNQTISKG